jgi:hypothetical protein
MEFMFSCAEAQCGGAATVGLHSTLTIGHPAASQDRMVKGMSVRAMAAIP